MSKKRRTISILAFVCIAALLLVAIVLTNEPGGKHESISEAMRDAVLHGQSAKEYEANV